MLMDVARPPSSAEKSAENLPCEDFEVKVPERLGGTTRVRVTGPEDAPLLIAVGGISANRFVCGHGDGKPGWWAGLISEGAVIDPASARVLGIDFIADDTGRRAPTTREQAEAIVAALDHLGLDKAHALIGASYGGMIGLSLAQYYPERLDRLVVISAADAPYPAATAWRELQRRVVALGIESGTKNEALAIARGMGMMSYRTAEEFEQRFEGGLATDDPLGRTDPGDYLRARGAAFQKVMTPERFLSLSASIDRHRIDPEDITTPTLLIGAETDQLVPASQLQALAQRLAGPVELHVLSSIFGHDMFLKEATRMGELIKPFLETEVFGEPKLL
jgi:homoserine O-acetyltransferase